MMSFLKNNFYRLSSKRYNVITALIMTVCSITLAVYLNTSLEVKDNLALVTGSKEPAFQSASFNITVMEQAPPRYQLVLGKYDGVIIEKGNEEYLVETIKGDDYKQMLETAVNSSGGFVPQARAARGVGTNIIGYLMVFVLLQCVLFMFTLADDLELKQVERIAAAPVSFVKYLLAHFVSTFILIFTPAFFMLLVLKITGLNIGFSLLQYAALLGLLCSLGIAFAMFVNSLIKAADTANMMGSSIVLLTTILSGSFYSFEKGNQVLEQALWILPQKSFLSLVQGLEAGDAAITMLPQLAYVVLVAVLCFTFAIVIIKRDYVAAQ